MRKLAIIAGLLILSGLLPQQVWRRASVKAGLLARTAERKAEFARRFVERKKQFAQRRLLSVQPPLFATSPPQQRKVKTNSPQIFGAGTISTGEVYRGSFAPDGRAFYFFRKVTPGQEDYRIFVSRLRQGQWLVAEQIKLGGDYSDLYPSLSREGQRMVFASYRPVPGSNGGKPDANLWYVDRKGEG